MEPEREKNKLIWWVALVFILGSFSGWGLFKLAGRQREGGSGGEKITALAGGEKVESGKTYGQENGTFADRARGVIESNQGGEVGTHKLLREGGESQTAFLTSSVLDLEMFIGHEVEVWGETFSSEKVGWLMDVGRIKVLK